MNKGFKIFERSKKFIKVVDDVIIFELCHFDMTLEIDLNIYKVRSLVMIMSKFEVSTLKEIHISMIKG